MCKIDQILIFMQRNMSHGTQSIPQERNMGPATSTGKSKKEKRKKKNTFRLQNERS